MKKLIIKNKSLRVLPEEVIVAIENMTIDEANTVLEDYNLKIIEIERDYDDDGKIMTETVTLGGLF